MKVRYALLIAALMIVMSLAGCLGGSPGDSGEDDPEPSPTDGTGGGGNGSEPAPVPMPPTARFVILDNGSALAPVNGSFLAIAGMNLTFDASSSTDPEGAPLSYAWVLGGDEASGIEVVKAFEEGEHDIMLTVTDADGLSDFARVMLNASAAGASFIFYDGAEDDSVAWTFASHIFVSLNTDDVPEETIEEEHPDAAGWHITEEDAFAGVKSWTMRDEAVDGYHDNERVIMTSPVIDLTGVSKASLSFLFKGDAEANNKDGVYWFVSSDAGETWTQLGMQSGLVAEWTQVEADLGEHAGGEIQIRFEFRSDISCSQDTDQVSDVCGAGEYKGYWLDEIVVASP
jgi:hypothetical protein